MYNLHYVSTNIHNEATKSRQKRDTDDESSLMSTFHRFGMFSSASQTEILQNIATKDIATDSIQNALLHANKLVKDRLIVTSQSNQPAVSIHEPLHRNNAPAFATLYQVTKNTKDKDKKTVLKADRNVLHRLITAYEAGRPVDLPSVLKHELLPVPVSLAEMNGTLRTSNKSGLASILTETVRRQ